MSITNAKITSASLSMADYGCLTWRIDVEGDGWGVSIGGYCIGKGYLDAKVFEGSAKGTESIMRVMDTVGVSRWEDLPGKYIRVEAGDWGDTVTKFGNIIHDKWFDCREFFSNGTAE